MRAYDHMGQGPLESPFGTWQGGAVMFPLAYLLGGPTAVTKHYASSYHGQDEGGGLSVLPNLVPP